jgi:hypothetical protein
MGFPFPDEERRNPDAPYDGEGLSQHRGDADAARLLATFAAVGMSGETAEGARRPT